MLKLCLEIVLLCIACCHMQHAAVIYQHPTAVLGAYQTTYHAAVPAAGSVITPVQPPAAVAHATLLSHDYHPAYTVVAPLTKIAHVTYDSVPISHTPFEHVPLFQRVSHVKTMRL